MASGQQFLSKRFKGFQDVALNLTYHLELVGEELLENQKNLKETMDNKLPVHVEPTAQSCDVIDYSAINQMLEDKDKELQIYNQRMEDSLHDLETALSDMIGAERAENEKLRTRILELEQTLSKMKDRNRHMEKALMSCVTVDDLRRSTEEFFADVPSVTSREKSGKLCFDDENSLENAVIDVVAGAVLPRLTQLAEERFVELSDIQNQVNQFLDKQQERHAPTVIQHRIENRQNCMYEEDVRTIVSNTFRRECTGISLESLGLQSLIEKAQSSHDSKSQLIDLPPDHAQRGAGAEVVHSLTSPTFSRPLPDGNSTSTLHVAAFHVWDFMSNLFQLENGVGKPEDAISHKVTVGQCWAMRVSN